MTRKDYELIAKAIGWTIEDGARRNNLDTAALHYFTGVMAEMLQAENPRFNKGRFIDAVQKFSE